MASKRIKSVRLTNFTDQPKKIWHWQLNSKAPVEDEYFDVKSGERLYLDFRASSGYLKEAEKLERNDSKISVHILLKDVATKKLSWIVWAHSLGEYLYILTKSGLTLRHKTYTINQTDDDLLEWEENNL